MKAATITTLARSLNEMENAAAVAAAAAARAFAIEVENCRK